jgi:hypothetical protein
VCIPQNRVPVAEKGVAKSAGPVDAELLSVNQRDVSVVLAKRMADESEAGLCHKLVRADGAKDDRHDHVWALLLFEHVSAEFEACKPERACVRACDHVKHALSGPASETAAVVAFFRVSGGGFSVPRAMQQPTCRFFFCRVGQGRAERPPDLTPWDAQIGGNVLMDFSVPILFAVRA